MSGVNAERSSGKSDAAGDGTGLKGGGARDFRKPATFDVLGTPIAAVNPASFMETIEAWLTARSPSTPGAFVCFRDVHGVVRALDDPAVAEAHRRAFMNVPDGMPLVWAAHRHGYRQVTQVAGPDTFPAVCRAGLAKGWRHVLYGGTPEALADLRTSLLASMPGIVIVEAISPPFGILDEDEQAGLIARIVAARPDFVWVGLGSPKQELWMAEHAAKIPGAISMGVGAAFNVHSGGKRRAPQWIRKAGLEWLFRAAQEPRRLGPRYLHAVPRYAWAMLREKAGQGGRRRHRM